MSNNDSWSPEEIARANDRQREIIETEDQEKALFELKKSSSTQGWGIFTWLIVFVITLGIVVSSKTSIKSEYHHGFLYALIFLQAVLGSLIIRAFAALFKCTSAWDFLGGLLTIAVLGVILFLVAIIYLFISGNAASLGFHW
ncbi:hypothetical protein [Methylovulum sp.]|uniref:hypothetical protein n=1 Tax=Methylovulum sp. TaxID=1916980 RepID=UPI0026121AB1|nr:hypothetical protein [Methylovulum sp.]MDD5125834.1 hypothetical protein [Methylovulum sp.]